MINAARPPNDQLSECSAPASGAAHDVYLAGTGLWLPLRASVAAAAAEGRYDMEAFVDSQMESVAVSHAVYPPDMAVAAGRQALASSPHGPEDISLLLHAYVCTQGIRTWHAGSYVHRKVLGTVTPVIEVGQMSNGGMAALSLAIDHLRADSNRLAALVTTADRFQSLSPPHTRYTYNNGVIFGDGAAALVVSCVCGFARLRSFCTHADTTLEQFHRGASRFTGDADTDPVSSLPKRKREFLQQHSLDETVEKLRVGNAAAVNNALEAAGVKKKDIARWVFSNFGLRELSNTYLGPLNVPLEATCWSFGRTVGHLGAGDQLAGLHHLRSSGALVPGELYALVGVGAGFHWSCAVLEIQ